MIPEVNHQSDISNQKWRLNNLYTISTKENGKQKFKMNEMQERYFDNLWYRNCVLKARQLGSTSINCILALDRAIFEPGVRIGIIAQTFKDAQEMFRTKIKDVWDALPQVIKDLTGGVAFLNKTEIIFKNGSSIRVGVSLRSGTYDFLLVSEFGKIASNNPRHAREIITGAFPAVQSKGTIIVESTAEGSTGAFFDMCETARSKKRIRKIEGTKLTKLDFKFHFFNWTIMSEYSVDPQSVKISPDDEKYFESLITKKNIVLSPEQKAWYVTIKSELGDDMRREYPHYPDEAFEQSVKGSYFGTQIQEAEEQDRITNVPYDSKYGVETWWDLGFRDKMVVIFVQRLPGGAIHIIDYYETTLTTIEEVARELLKKPYRYTRHVVPWDGKAHVDPFGDGRTRTEIAESVGLRPWQSVGLNIPVQDQIQSARQILPRCYFDKKKTIRLIESLKAYRKEWDRNLGVYKDHPRHDIHSHAADAFRTGAIAPSDSPKDDLFNVEKLELLDFGAV